MFCDSRVHCVYSCRIFNCISNFVLNMWSSHNLSSTGNIFTFSKCASIFWTATYLYKTAQPELFSYFLLLIFHTKHLSIFQVFIFTSLLLLVLSELFACLFSFILAYMNDPPCSLVSNHLDNSWVLSILHFFSAIDFVFMPPKIIHEICLSHNSS